MTMLARTTEGMHNLFRISSLASLEGQYRKPRIDRDLLERYGKGLIATTGCPSGEVNIWLRAGQYDEARQAAADYQDIFGKENFFVELMDHGLDIEKRVRDGAAGDRQGPRHPAAGHQRLALHARGGRAGPRRAAVHPDRLQLDDPNRFRFDGDGYYLKSAAEMRALFADMPEGCDNTLLVAEQCEVMFEFARPDAPLPGARGGERGLLVPQGGRRGLDQR